VRTGERLRVLFVAPFPPRRTGTHGGATVVGQLIHGTAERHDVGVVYLHYPGEPDLDDELRERLEIVQPVTRSKENRRDLAHWGRAVSWRTALLAGRPRLVTELTIREAALRLGEVAQSWRPHVVRFEYPVTATYLPALAQSGAVRVLADYDALLETTGLPSSLLERLEQRLDERAWRRFRRRILVDVDATVVPTERDRATLATLAAEADIVCVPFGADVDAPALDPGGKDDAGLLFVGNFNHRPNRDSALFLATEVLPRVRLDQPDATLRLVGEAPPEVSGLSHVEATGRVPDVRPFLDAAAVVVAPARLGAGMRVKVMEALVAGKALVATPLAVAGLALDPGRHALVVEPADFADAVSTLLADRARRIELGQAAREWAVENLRWDERLDDHDALYERLLASRSARARS
jgi:glycosyltransferase involved in cell wall biosynthesis